MEDKLDVCDDELEKKKEEWKVKQAKDAEDYYYKEIFPLVKKNFELCTCSTYQNKYENLIISLGLSFEPLVLTITALKPEKILFLHTRDSNKNLDKVIELTGLSPSQYITEEIIKDDPADIYRTLKKVYVNRWKSPDKTVIDFTGGTKAMSAGMAMAGAYFKIDLIYVASEYDSKMRKPVPGTEELKIVEDPYKVFGDLEKEKGIALFNRNDFVSAGKIFSELERRVAERDYAFYKSLSNIYYLWDCMSFHECIEKFEELFSAINSWKPIEKDLEAYKYYNALHQQYELIKPLEAISLNDKNDECKYIKDKNFYVPLIFSIYANALRRGKEGKYDVAILLLYRVLELIAQVRLASYEFNVSSPDYSVFSKSEEELLSEMNENIKPFKNFREYGDLPRSNMALFDAYVLIKAIGDKLMENIKIKLIYFKVQLRNKSIFAHGFKILQDKDFNNFHEIVKRILTSFCEINDIDFENTYKNYEFIELC
ncbi:TIGR02710 family CRISPR-associated protein [Aceticella autotrophica]|uniref:TIGR02710 family CRISPR-associated protein n=1 Tax=Aceticella autotrophica TaxID=2755338 RepID=A0A975GAY3_9THEO|nr:TIGR02710 family CRISPR-associated CARF protein [Aceticella autotrophica]QSZ27582.1 TIGR02710 family CRISPR-associated protein [Aceticella autotrophica]